MKKVTFLGVAFTLSFLASAQQAGSAISPQAAKRAFLFSPKNNLPGDETPVLSGSADQKAIAPVSSMNTTGIKIGQTQYDLQSNSSIGSKLINHADGTLSAVWTISPNGYPYTPRGTGYNYFDGSKWLYPDTVTHNVVNRLETIRTGYPDLGYLKDARDIVVAHATNTYTEYEGTNSLKGTMPFNFFQTGATFPRGTSGGAIWPRIAIGGAGDSTIHMIANYADTFAVLQGVKQPLVYSRSQNSGTSWDIVAAPLPGMDSTRQRYGSGDDYAIAAKGNNVAILSGGLGHHVTLWTSANNGTSWSRSLVDSFPYTPDYATMAPVGNTSIPTNDGSMDLMFDASNNIHVVYAMSMVGRDAAGNGVFVPGTVGLVYWNSVSNTKVNIPVPLSAVDVNSDGNYSIGVMSTDLTTCRYRNMSVLHIPNIGMDAAGNIFVTFSLIADNDTTSDGQGFRDVWVVSSTNGGATWSAPVNLTNTVGTEEAFPALAERVDNFLHIIYQEDSQPGTALTNGDADGINNIKYLKVNASLVTTGVASIESNDLFSVGQNFPNPLNGSTAIPLTLTRPSEVLISVTNVMGQKVFETHTASLGRGYHNIGIDAAKLNSGIYFYTVKAGNFSVTKRMIVEN